MNRALTIGLLLGWLVLLAIGGFLGWTLKPTPPVPPRSPSHDSAMIAQRRSDSIRILSAKLQALQDSAWKAYAHATARIPKETLQGRATGAGNAARAEVRAKDPEAEGDAPEDTGCTITTTCALERWRQTADSLKGVRRDSLERALLVAGASCSSTVWDARARGDSLVAAKPTGVPVWQVVTGAVVATIIIILEALP